MALDKKIETSSFLNRLWRFMASGFGFFLFGIGALFLSFTLFPLYNIVIRNQQRRRIITQRTIRFTFTLFLYGIKKLGILNFQFENLEALHEDQGCIIIANHPSLLDYVLLASRMPVCDCVVKENLLENFYVRNIIKAANYIPNSHLDTFFPACQKQLSQGGMLLVFPEGTRTTFGEKIVLQRGAANIALRTQSNIRLITIYSDYPLLTKEHKWFRIPLVKPTFNIKVEEKITIDSYLKEEANLSISARNLTNEITKRLNHNLERLKNNQNEITY